MNKKLVFAAVMGLTCGVAFALNATPQYKGKPNILMIYTDDLGWGDLSCHGHPYAKTPNIDNLAKEGIDFQQFEVVNPVCSPSRAALMTGQYPARYSVHGHFDTVKWNRKRGMTDWLDPQAVMLPRLLKQAGYATAHYGKWHLSNADALNICPKATEYGYDDYAGWNGPKPSCEPRAIYDRALDFIRTHRDKPFFINLWMHETHTPHHPSKESMAQYAHLNKREQVYAAVLADADKGVGKVLDGLNQMGLADNTLVVFSSDNGPSPGGMAGEPKGYREMENYYGNYYSVGRTGDLRGCKATIFEGGVRTPLIVRWPGKAPAGKINDKTVVAVTDLLPTFCAAAGVELPAGYKPDGENMLNAFKGEEITRSKPIFWDWRMGRSDLLWYGKNKADWVPGAEESTRQLNWATAAVRDGDWKLVMNNEQSRIELYDFSKDCRDEITNVAKKHPEVVQRLIAMWKAWANTLPTAPDPNCQVSKIEP